MRYQNIWNLLQLKAKIRQEMETEEGKTEGMNNMNNKKTNNKLVDLNPNVAIIAWTSIV